MHSLTRAQISARTRYHFRKEPRAVERLLIDLSQGCTMTKVKSARKHFQRTYFLDINNMTLNYEGSRRRNKNTIAKISKIREVREGEKDWSKAIKDLDKSRCLVIIFGAVTDTIYLMAPDQQIRDKWVRGLKYAMQIEQLAEQRNETDRLVREAFNMADRNRDGALDFEEILKLLKTLNLDIKRKYAKEMFDAADTRKNVGERRAVLDREEFVHFYHELTKRTELDEIFLAYSRDKGYMTIHDLLSFLREGQKNVTATEDECRNIIDFCEPEGPCKHKDQLSELGFRNYLVSEGQQIFNPHHRVTYQDMNRPMTHYFVASSHNTYLAEDQLKGPSKVEMYITALRRGCRCVELDCWNGPDNEPVIYHGHTLTSKILFKDVCKAVNDYAFEISPYPVTLSLENHCSVEQQHVMARHMLDIFGDKLWCPSADLISVPSPEELRHKIIVKGKKLPSSENEGDVSDEDEALSMTQDLLPHLPTPNNGGPPLSPIHALSSIGLINTNTDKTTPGPKGKADNPPNASSSSSKKKVKLSSDLSRLTSMKSVGFKAVEPSSQADPCFSVVSLGERKVEGLIKSNPAGLNRITQTKIIRTYPSGTRTESSNYNPVPMWNHGCQVVALNYQTGGDPMQLNHGRFLDNGASGYVLKPQFLMSEDLLGIINGSVCRSMSKILKLTIISGYQIPKPNDSPKGEIIDPFVLVKIHGVPGDIAEYKSQVIQNNGFNPIWKENCSFKIRVPELALLRIIVKDEDRGSRDDFIGYYCLPVMSIQEGFRHLPLFDKNGNQYNQTLLFTHVRITNA